MLNWNGLEDTKSCIASLKKNTYPNFEIIIVDNGSEDGSKEWLKSQKDIVLVDLPKNEGVTGGHIAGHNVAKGEFVANLNNDAMVAKDWLMELYKAIIKDESIAVTGGKAFEWDDNNPIYNEDNTYFTYQVLDLYGGYAHTMRTGVKETAVNSISTVGALMRKSAIEKVGYFDNDFFAYYDETDLFARFKRAGYKIVYTPEAKLWHMIGNSTKDIPYFYLYHMHRNRFIFAVKNYDRKYLLQFFKIYTRDSLIGTYLWARGSKDINHQAQYKAYFWNLKHFFHNFRKRSAIKKLGPKFNELLLNESAEYVSVVIPCYNYGDYVAEAIESALNQTQAPLEIIVINDGSTDNSLDVIKKYKDKVQIIDHENQGIIRTKNIGIEKAQGEWIIFLDADDKLEPTYIEETLRYARANNKDVVYTDMQYFGSKKKIFEARPYSRGSLLNGNYINNSALHRRSFLQRVGGYKQEMKDGYEDWEINISVAEKGAKFGYIPKPLMLYRQHSQTSQRNDNAIEKAAEIIKIVRSLHRKSYFIHKFKIYQFVSLSVKIIKNPLLIIVIALALPLAIFRAWIAFPLAMVFHAWARIVKHYINS